MAAKAYVSFLRSNGNVYDNYVMRFNQLASVLLDGVEYVTMRKNANYIVLEPANNVNQDEKIFHVWHTRGVAMISLARLVRHDGAINQSAFGKRYKVKHDKQNRVYICMNEVVGYAGDQ